jgi:peptidoglycan/LPS O-acetylase OafA/YrhL
LFLDNRWFRRLSEPLKTERFFYPGLEGLRGVSVLAVLLFHVETLWVPGGFLGVSTFFTLSGFLITGLLAREWDDRHDIRLANFWARRLRRLLPASLLALLAIAVIGGALSDSIQKERLLGDGLAALFYFSNWWLIVTGAAYDNLMGSPSVIQHFWSLSIEEQYYFVYPVVAYAIFRTSGGSRKVFGSVLALSTIGCWGWLFWLAGTDASTARLYYGTDTRAGELLAGGALALALGSRAALPAGRLRSGVLVAGILGLLLTVGGWAIATVESVGLYKGGIALYALGTLAVIAAAVQPTGPVRALLSWPPLRWVGRISYGVYVYHWPIFLWVDHPVARIVLTFLAAELSYRFLEEPIRSRRWLLGWGRFAAPPVAMGIIVLAFGFSLPDQGGVAVAPDSKAGEQAALSTSRDVPLRIAIVGDSVAQDIGEGLSLWADRSSQALVRNIAARGCGIARGAWNDDDRRNVLCDNWPKSAREVFAEFKPDIVVAVTAGWDLRERKLPEWDGPRVIGDPAFDRWIVGQYGDAFDVFREFGGRVVWLTTPCFKSPQGIRTGVFDPARARRMNDYVLPTLAVGREGELTILDLEAAVCPDGKFADSLLGIENFRREDGIHFSNPGKLWVGTWLGEELVHLNTAVEPTVRARR